MQRQKVNFVLHDGIADVIKDLVDWYDQGLLDGVLIAVKRSDGAIYSLTTTELSYIEKLGMIELLKDDIKALTTGTEED